MAVYGCSVSSDYFQWIPIVSILVLITFFVISIVYMLSQFLKRPDWAYWAKSEMWQTIIACILVGGIFAITGLACVIAENLAGGDPFFISDRYLHNLVWNKVVPAVDNLFKLSFQAQKESVYTTAMVSCSFGVCFQPHAGLATLSYNFETMAALITPFGASLLFQKLFLQFIKEIAFSIILPIGLILKVFPFTRDAGAFLIAAALAFYVVFPLTYVFNQMLMYEVMQDPMVVGWCDPGIANTSGLGYSMCQSLSTIGQILPQAVFLPALNMIITVSFMQAFSKLLSRDYQEDFI